MEAFFNKKPMNKNIVVFLVFFVIIAAIGLYYYSFANRSGKIVTPPLRSGSVPAQTQNPPDNPGLTAAVAISNFSFEPASVTVKVGTTVTWTNNDTAPHQIKSDTFNSPVLSKGQTFSFTFSAAGTYDYSCNVHPSMKGQIIVQ